MMHVIMTMEQFVVLIINVVILHDFAYFSQEMLYVLGLERYSC